MNDDAIKAHLHQDLRRIRSVLGAKLDGLGEYDVRRPLTATGTNLLGLVKHVARWEAFYLGEVFGRPFPEPMAPWQDDAANRDCLWVTDHETRAEIVDHCRRVWRHADETIEALDLDAPGHVSWWRRPEVNLFKVLVHLLDETNRHAGHADILREQLDGATGDDPTAPRNEAEREAHRTRIEQAARAAG